MYEYAARLNRVIDGDTVSLDIDLGFNVHIRQHIRLLGINCPEHGTPAGDDATAYTAGWFAQYGPDLVLRTIKDRDDKYGRMLGRIVAQARTLNDDLVTDGHAAAYDGGKRTLPNQAGEAQPANPVP